MSYLLRLLILAVLLASCGRPSNPAADFPRQDSSVGAAVGTPAATTPEVLPLRPTVQIAASATPPPAAASPILEPPPTTAAPTAVISTPAPREITGDSALSITVRYPENSALPADAVLTMQLRLGQGSFLYDHIGAEQVIPVQAGSMPFTYAYDSAAIDPSMTYSLVAEVRAGERRLLTGAVPALIDGVADAVEVQLHPLPTVSAVGGTVIYPGGNLLPPGSALTVRLTTPIDGVGGPLVISEQRINADQSGRADFFLPIDRDAIDPYRTYNVFAELVAPGRLTLFTEAPALTYGAPTSLDLAITPSDGARTLSGKALLPDGVTLPADAVLSVQMAYIYNGTIGDVVRDHTFAPGSTGPVPFLIEYLPESFLDNTTYALYASVRQGPKLLFTTPLIALDPAAIPASIDGTLQPPSAIQRVEGTISFPQGALLPADTTLAIQLADLRWVFGDGQPIVIAEQIITPGGATSIGFAIEYDPIAIDSRSDYAILSELSAGGKRIFTGAWASVITNGHPNQVDIVLEPAQ